MIGETRKSDRVVSYEVPVRPACSGVFLHPLLQLAERAEYSGRGEDRRVIACRYDNDVTMLRGNTGSAKFMLHGLDRNQPPRGALNLTGDQELNRGDVVQQDRPRQGNPHVQPLREIPAGIEHDSTAGEVQGVANSRIQNASATDQLPFQVKPELVPPICS